MIQPVFEDGELITVETESQLIDFAVEDFAVYFTTLHNVQGWQFPARWGSRTITSFAGGNQVIIPGKNDLTKFMGLYRLRCTFRPKEHELVC